MSREIDNSLLKENENKRLNLRLPLLICFAMFAVWQMGMIYFSGQTMSVDGRSPLPVNVDDVTVLVAAGYILSILVMIFIPRIIVWAERVTASAALLSALVLFLPLSPEILAAALYAQYFCCCFMIGFEPAVIIGLFNEKTAVLHLTAAYVAAMLLVAVLQNDFIKIDFAVFNMFTIVALVLIVFFFFKLPTNSWTRTAKKADGLIAQKKLFAGIFFWVIMSCFVVLFGVAVAEKFTHGVSVFYLSAAIFSFVVYFLWKRCGIVSFKSFSIAVSTGAIGFILAIDSLHIPALSLVVCVFLGAGSMGCWTIPLFGIYMSKQYPSKFISPSIIGIAFIAVLTHTALLGILRNNTNVLYVVYLVIAVGLVILYLILEPYLLYSFRGRSLQKIIERHNVVEGQKADAPAENEALKKLKRAAIQPLSDRECQIGEMTILGIRQGVIAETLKIDTSTVKYHRTSLYNKFGVGNRDELVRRVEEMNLMLDE